MCLILIANKIHPQYKLIVAANRDEFYNRPTAPIDFWDDNPQILAGRDLKGGGTWMGMNRKGKISMLTNYRDLSRLIPDAPSRGHLVSDFLQSEESAPEYLGRVSEKGHLYNGFNIICGDVEELYYYSNYNEGTHLITPGNHGISNALLNSNWPKVSRGLEKMKMILRDDLPDPLDLLEALYDDIKAPQNLLPNTGVGRELETVLSSMFIKSADYGSRCSTVLMVDHKNQVQYLERSYEMKDYSYTDRRYNLRV